METLTTLWHDPAAQVVVWTFIGVLLAKVVWPFLERKAKATPTMADDEFLDHIEIMFNDIVTARLTPKDAPKKTVK